MSSAAPFRPFEDRAELRRGRRQVFVNLLISVVAVVLAVVAERTVGDPRLVQTYVVGAVLFLVASIGPAIRWSNTPAPDPGE